MDTLCPFFSMPASFIILNSSSFTFTAFIPRILKEKKKDNSLPLFFAKGQANFKHDINNPITAQLPFFHCSAREEEEVKSFQKLPMTIGRSSKKHL